LSFGISVVAREIEFGLGTAKKPKESFLAEEESLRRAAKAAGLSTALRSGPNEQTGRVHTGEQINFPHLAKNERDMGHPQVWLGKSFKGCSFHT
jgi:hypothetical protein